MSCCPKCRYPNPSYKGIYTPGEPCPKCGYQSKWRGWPRRRRLGLPLKPSPAAHEAAVALLTPPPEFQVMLELLRQNTLLLKQTEAMINHLARFLLSKEKAPAKRRASRR